MMNDLKLSVDVSMWLNTKGISSIRIDGPYVEQESTYSRTELFRLSAWITRHPNPEDPPDFYAELDRGALINMRNALSAALFATEGR